jgi:hypothetical protein
MTKEEKKEKISELKQELIKEKYHWARRKIDFKNKIDGMQRNANSQPNTPSGKSAKKRISETIKANKHAWVNNEKRTEQMVYARIKANIERIKNY